MLINELSRKSLRKLLINEGVETKNMKAAKHYLYDKMGYNEQQAMQCIGSIKTDIPNSRLGKCKFMLAMVRMFCNNEFNEGSVIMDVNKSLKYAASDAHINEYNQDLNGLTSKQFIERFTVFSQQDLEQDKKDVSSQEYNEKNSKYQIVRINSFYDAEEYGDYVDWCVTHDESMFESYTNNGNGVFYFCLRNGWEDEQQEQGENCPLDSYGLSMIAVSINSDGSCNTITCRWNHDNNGNDHIMTPKQLSEVIGRNFYNTFKPLTPEEIKRNMQEKVYRIQEEIYEYGIYENPSEYCETLEYDPDYGDTDERNLYVYQAEESYLHVVIDESGDLIINMVFDKVEYRVGDVMVVQSGNKANFLTTQGQLISDTWFENVSNQFDKGFGLVYNAKKWNMIDKQGNYLLKQWHDAIGHGTLYNDWKGNRYIEVIDNKKSNFVDMNTGENVFKKPIVKIFNANENNMFIKFEGDDFIMLFDPKTLKQKAPWQIKSLQGYYQHRFYGVELLDNKNYLLDNSANLYDFETKQKIKDNPYNQQMPNENKKRTVMISENQCKKLGQLFSKQNFNFV